MIPHVQRSILRKGLKRHDISLDPEEFTTSDAGQPLSPTAIAVSCNCYYLKPLHTQENQPLILSPHKTVQTNTKCWTQSTFSSYSTILIHSDPFFPWQHGRLCFWIVCMNSLPNRAGLLLPAGHVSASWLSFRFCLIPDSSGFCWVVVQYSPIAWTIF
jgi:hypothetical protein